MTDHTAGNIDPATVKSFGEEWAAFDQTKLDPVMHEKMAEEYFSIFPFDKLPCNAEGFDLGCGSGRWAAWVLPKVGKLHCIDPAAEALAVAKFRMAGDPKAVFHHAGVDDFPLAPASQDFGYCLGVLHHIPDTEGGLRECVRRLKRGAPFLVYLYYSFDNRPAWFRGVWHASNVVRGGVSKLPFPLKKGISNLLAATLYWPLARSARLLEKAGMNVSNIPLSNYRWKTFYTMRTDSLDRFGTRLEHRFTRAQIKDMMERCGLENIRFRETEPFWVACGVRSDARL
ncbi:MAG: class I SAM-dependent methyltransferase [Sphingomicrobium sp.]